MPPKLRAAPGTLDEAGLRAGPDDGAWMDLLVRDVRAVGVEADEWRVTDCRFEGCDLSAAVFSDLVLTRVELVTCRLFGADFGGARMTDVRFVGCKLDEANLRFVRGERVRFEDCVLTGADLQSATLEPAAFEACRLEGTSLQRASLAGATYEGCDLSGVVGLDGLRGAVLSSAQVFDLAPRLAVELAGITVSD